MNQKVKAFTGTNNFFLTRKYLTTFNRLPNELCDDEMMMNIWEIFVSKSNGTSL